MKYCEIIVCDKTSLLLSSLKANSELNSYLSTAPIEH